MAIFKKKLSQLFGNRKRIFVVGEKSNKNDDRQPQTAFFGGLSSLLFLHNSGFSMISLFLHLCFYVPVFLSFFCTPVSS